MLILLADEDFNNDILRGVKRRNPNIDLIRVQDTQAAGQSDATVLDLAAQLGRVLLTHDVNTLLLCAYDRVEGNLPMAGVAAVSQSTAIALAIDEIFLITESSEPEEWQDQVR
jgi:hypothetical protein